ncbi:MAG: PAS domain-containing protein, partial [Candidatus Adiutrix sp.]
MYSSPIFTDEFITDLFEQIECPVFVMNTESEKLVHWNEAFATQAQKPPKAHISVGDFLGSHEARDWLLQCNTTGQVWAGLVGGEFGHLVNVRIRIIHINRKDNLLAASMQSMADWLLTTTPLNFKAIFDNFAGGVSFVDSMGHIQVCNNFLKTFFNRSGEEILKRRFDDLFPRKVGTHLFEAFQRVLITGHDYDETVEFQLADKHYFLHVHLAQVVAKDGLLGVCFSFQDI